MRKLSFALLVLTLLIAAALPAYAQDDTIVDTAVGSDDFSTLVAAVQAAGLVETLNGAGPFTVFAPTNDAFAAFLETEDITAEELLANTDLLTRVLTYHVVPGRVAAADVVNVTTAPTVEGSPIYVRVADGNVILNNETNVIATDIEASNGIIHVIDYVLVPPLAYTPPIKVLALTTTPILADPQGTSTGLVLQECRTGYVTGYEGGYFLVDVMGGWVDQGSLAFIADNYGQPGGQPIAPQCVGR